MNSTKQIQQQRFHRFATLAMLCVTSLIIAGIPTYSLSQTPSGKSYSLFGSPQCSEWVGMNADARFTWTSAFLSTLSMGHETSRRAGQQKFKDLQGIDQVVAAVSFYCAAYPEGQASEAAAPFLN